MSAHQESAFLTTETKRACIRNGHHLRKLRIRLLSDLVLGVFEDLRELNLTHLVICNDTLPTPAVQQLCRILERCGSRMRVLQVDRPPLVQDMVVQLLRTISQSLDHLQHLELFSMQRVTVPQREARVFLETMSSDLETVELGLEFCVRHNTQETTMIETMRAIEGGKEHPHLWSFGLSAFCNHDLDKVQVPRVLVPFLRGCRNLRVTNDHIYLTDVRMSWILAYPEVLEVLGDIMGLHRRTFSFTYQCLATEPDFAKELSSLRIRENGMQEIWHVLLFHGAPKFPAFECTKWAFVEMAQKGLIERFCLAAGHLMTSQDMHIILRDNRSLLAVDFTSYPTLMSSDIVQEPWSCRWLTMLYVHIAGIPRPDIQVGVKGERIPKGTLLHSGTMEESRAIQKKVYGQLGALVFLKDLRLGCGTQKESNLFFGKIDQRRRIPTFDLMVQMNCLEMTLDSGLDLLSDLKDLRRLAVN
ncbi:hypothetical protein BGZ95_002106, partial [Linnemannia exigua]